MKQSLNFLKSPGLVIMHVPCLLLIWAGVSRVALVTCAALYLVRGIGITAGYHRYFSHRSFKTSRVFQFVLACLGASAVQQGPLWWAAHHRRHHKYSDTERDVHSPARQGFWWAHMGWIAAPENQKTDYKTVADFARYSELRWLNKLHLLPPVLLALALWLAGSWLERHFPELRTNGFQLLTWGFFVCTILLFHGTFAINSLTHLIGRQRFPTGDDSRNSLVIALFTLGEGWHNNHHYFPASERQGFFWWEIDFTHYVLCVFERLGLVWDVQAPPERVYRQAAQRAATGGRLSLKKIK
jgi:stearoyl-CoA desaturase (delta-9 desaturase)